MTERLARRRKMYIGELHGAVTYITRQTWLGVDTERNMTSWLEESEWRSEDEHEMYERGDVGPLHASARGNNAPSPMKISLIWWRRKRR